MVKIHPTALVDSSADLGADVTVGPFCVVGPDVKLGDGVVLHSHVAITGRSTLGEKCQVYPFASIGTPPQDQKYKGEPNSLTVGANTVIREHVTINPGTPSGDTVTRVGSNCFLLVGAHIAHDCQVGDDVLMVNGSMIAGHVSLGDRAILGGLSAVHQYVRIGAYAFIGGMTGITADVIPFGMAVGNRATLQGLNLVGLRRNGFSRQQIQELRQAYRVLFANEGTLLERLEAVETSCTSNVLVRQVVDFMKSHSDRSFCVPDMSAASSQV